MTANLQQSDTSGSGWENLTDPVTVASVPSNAKVEIFAKPTKRYVRVSVSEDAAGTLPLHASYYILDDGDTDIRIGTYVSGFPVRD